MSKTREIEGWVYKSDIANERYNFNQRMPDNFKDIGAVKAKLIIEVPEKRISISESEFDEAWKWLDSQWSIPDSDMGKELKQKLFGTK